MTGHQQDQHMLGFGSVASDLLPARRAYVVFWCWSMLFFAAGDNQTLGLIDLNPLCCRLRSRAGGCSTELSTGRTTNMESSLVSPPPIYWLLHPPISPLDSQRAVSLFFIDLSAAFSSFFWSSSVVLCVCVCVFAETIFPVSTFILIVFQYFSSVT